MNTITHYNDLIRKSLAFPEFRITLDKAGCRFHVVLTQGVRHTVEDMFDLFCKIALFNDFNENNDPYGEHDFLIVQHENEAIYAKFDYYDRLLEYASPDPADLSKTCRVLTIMLAAEY